MTRVAVVYSNSRVLKEKYARSNLVEKGIPLGKIPIARPVSWQHVTDVPEDDKHNTFHGSISIDVKLMAGSNACP